MKTVFRIFLILIISASFFSCSTQKSYKASPAFAEKSSALEDKTEDPGESAGIEKAAAAESGESNNTVPENDKAAEVSDENLSGKSISVSDDDKNNIPEDSKAEASADTLSGDLTSDNKPGPGGLLEKTLKDVSEEDNANTPLPVKDSVKRTAGRRWAKKISEPNTSETGKDSISDPGNKNTEKNADKPDFIPLKESHENNAVNSLSEKGRDNEGESAGSVQPEIKKDTASAEKNIKKQDPVKSVSDSGNKDPGRETAGKTIGKSTYGTKADEIIEALKEEAEDSSDKGPAVIKNGKTSPVSEPFSGSKKVQPVSESGTDKTAAKDRLKNKTETSSAESGITVPDKAEKVKKVSEAEKTKETVSFEDPSHIVVVLDRRGWIYLGEEDGSRNIELLSRVFTDDSTVFSFKAGNGKLFILNFHLQNSDGSSRDAEVVLKENDSVKSADNKEDVSVAADKNAEPADEIEAGTENSAASGSEGGEEESEDYNKIFKEALLLIDKEEYQKASVLLEKVKQSPEQFVELDRLYFLLGQCYEKNRENRDPVKAEIYYSLILEQFPFSLYYDRAEIRRRYLLKYFINIR